MQDKSSPGEGDSDALIKSSQATESLLKSIQSIVNHYTKSKSDDDVSMSTERNKSTDHILQDAAGKILTLKQAQRNLGLKLGSDLSEELADKRRHVENQALLLHNILYEKNHLIKEIRSCKRLECPNLLKMAKDELENKLPSAVGTSGSTSGSTSTSSSPEKDADKADAVIDRFLAPQKSTTNKYSHRDPARHSYNLSKMHSELTTRGTLYASLLKAKKEKADLLEDLTKKRKFLHLLPNQINQLDKSVEVLRSYFNDKDMNPSQDLMNVGIGELERGQKAKELSTPLYTLFVQFGSFIQAHSGNELETDLNCQNWAIKVVSGVVTSNDDNIEMGNALSSSIDEETETQQFIRKYSRTEERVLQIQIPIAASKKDFVTIQFQYLPELKIVTAHVVQDKSLDLLWRGKKCVLLTDLFEGDDGNDLPLGCSSEIIYRNDGNNGNQIDHDEAHDEEKTMINETASPRQMALWKVRQSFCNNTKKGKPYSWCQYLAGLNYPRPKPEQDGELLETSQIEASTKIVLQLLHRRIRAHLTLAALLKKLSKNRPNPIPFHPSLVFEDSTSSDVLAKLISFEEENSSDELESSKVYCATIKRKQKSIKIDVKIDVRYPAMPPVWSLQPHTCNPNEAQHFSSSNKKSKLGDNIMKPVGGIGEQLPLFDSTLGAIESRVNSLEDSNMYYKDEIEETYDWILMHQLRCFIMEWDLYQKTMEGETVEISAKKDNWNRGRSRRGRDRCPTTLYELYKYGI